MNHAERAVEYYNNNFNCSQGVFTAFATELGIDEKLALRLGTNFGGGERKGELCGAVAGALMVLGLRCGHCESDDLEGKAKAYRISEKFMNRFIEKNGSVVPIEVKAGNTASVSLNNFINDYSPHIAYKLIANRNGITGVKETLPHYMVMFL